jgi:hypothetical protein
MVLDHVLKALPSKLGEFFWSSVVLFTEKAEASLGDVGGDQASTC